MEWDEPVNAGCYWVLNKTEHSDSQVLWSDGGGMENDFRFSDLIKKGLYLGERL